MKKTLMILTAVLLGIQAQATLQPVLYYTQTSYAGGAIDTSGSSPSVFNMAFNQGISADQVVDLSVSLNISGGYNGDLYAYLIAPNGTLMLLMDGASGLTGSGINNLTLVNPDPTGRAAQGVDPTFNGLQSSPSGGITGATDGGDNISGTYSGLFTFPVGYAGGLIYGTQFDPTGVHSVGTWGLFLSEVGDETSSPTLVSWTLNLAVVPEPVTLALGLFAVMLLALAGVKRFWVPKETAIKTES